MIESLHIANKCQQPDDGCFAYPWNTIQKCSLISQVRVAINVVMDQRIHRFDFCLDGCQYRLNR